MAKRKAEVRDVINVGFSTAKFEEARHLFRDEEKTLKRALSAAINKTLAKTRTLLLRKMTQRFTIKQKNLRRRTYLTKASPTRLSGKVRMMGREIGLINFAHREDRRKTGWGTAASGTGVHAQIIRGTKRQFRHSFIVEGNYGNVHVVERVERGGAVGTHEGRFPIQTVFSQRLNKLYDESPIPAEMNAFVPGDLDKQLSSQMDRFFFTAKR